MISISSTKSEIFEYVLFTSTCSKKRKINSQIAGLFAVISKSSSEKGDEFNVFLIYTLDSFPSSLEDLWRRGLWQCHDAQSILMKTQLTPGWWGSGLEVDVEVTVLQQLNVQFPSVHSFVRNLCFHVSIDRDMKTSSFKTHHGNIEW